MYIYYNLCLQRYKNIYKPKTAKSIQEQMRMSWGATFGVCSCEDVYMWTVTPSSGITWQQSNDKDTCWTFLITPTSKSMTCLKYLSLGMLYNILYLNIYMYIKCTLEMYKDAINKTFLFSRSCQTLCSKIMMAFTVLWTWNQENPGGILKYWACIN